MKHDSIFLGLVFGALLALPVLAGAADAGPSCLSPFRLASEIDDSLLERRDPLRGYTPFTLEDACVYASQRPLPSFGNGSCTSMLAAAGARHKQMLARDAAFLKLDQKLREEMPAFRKKTAALYPLWLERTEAFIMGLPRSNPDYSVESGTQRLASLEQQLNRGKWKQRYVEYSITLLRDLGGEGQLGLSLCLLHDRVGDVCAQLPLEELRLLSYEEFTEAAFESARASAVANDNALSLPSPIPVRVECLLKPKPEPGAEGELADAKISSSPQTPVASQSTEPSLKPAR